MTTQTPDPGTSRGGLRDLQRYADPSRPPAPRVYAVVGIVLGAAITLVGILPGIWTAVVVAAIGAAGVGYDRWLLHHHGVPRLRDLPAALRREQLLLIVVGAVVVAVPLVLAAPGGLFSLTTGAAAAGIGVALLLGVGGPIVDRRSRSAAAARLEVRRLHGSDPGV